MRVVFLVVAVCVVEGWGYNVGDPVDILKRYQYNGKRTEWVEVPAVGPTFGEASSAELSHSWPSPDPAKLALSLSHSRFHVPWTPILTGKGDLLVSLTLTLTRSDTDIVDMVAEAQCTLRVCTPSTQLHYVWVHQPRVNVDSARGVMAALGLAVAAAVVALSLLPMWMGDTALVDGTKAR